MITYRDYIEDIQSVATLDMPWNCFSGKSVLVTGATGLIGSFLVDLLCYGNRTGRISCKVYALSRSEEKLRKRFPDFYQEEWFTPVIQDITQPFGVEARMDYIVNCASNAHPRAYAEEPVETITANVLGLYNLMEHTKKYGVQRFLEISSVEVYGNCVKTTDDFSEGYCGRIDCNTLRAGYPESKRVCEALCQAYLQQESIPFVIARPCRIYGPTMSQSDSKAIAQFFRKALASEDVVLKSKGDQVFSYCYVSDAVSAILILLQRGEVGNAYNIADSRSIVSLAQLADMIASNSGRKVRFELPDQIENKGFSNATRGVLLTSKIERLGWRARVDIASGVRKTVSILKSIEQ